VRYASRCDRPDLIAVRVGLLGRLLLIFPVGEVAEILPREERIILPRSPRPTATERLRDWRERVQPGVKGAKTSDMSSSVDSGGLLCLSGPV
jgi:hypothetical protein